MNTNTFRKWVKSVDDDRRAQREDWPDIEAELVRIAGGMARANVRHEDAITFLIGLRACERMKDDPAREPMRKDATDYLNFTKGKDAKAGARRRRNELSVRHYDKLQSLLGLGFMLHHEKTGHLEPNSAFSQVQSSM